MGARVRDSEQSLQERLERLEAGESLEACLSGLPNDAADLLQLATTLREVQVPERDPDTVAVRRTALLKLAAKERMVDTRSTQDARRGSARSARTWLAPVAVFSGAMAVVCVCVLVAVAGAGLAWWASRDNIAQIPPSSPGATLEPGLARRSTPEPTAESASVLVPPTVSVPEVPDPQSAVLYDLRGVVEVQAGDGTWTAADAGHAVVAGQRVRTGGLSGARLAFYDGSQASLGPHTELSVDELDARSPDGPRVVVLTQWIGETEHDVVPADGVDAHTRYEVRTPSAVGEAQGTSFRVLVTPELLTRFSVDFSVDEGSVAATGLNVTVVVVAGQSTTIRPGEAPDEPVFRITGQGRVTQIGIIWIIAGQSLTTHDGTVIVGNPQVGDWVLVEGHLLSDGTRVADLIVLLRRSPADRFTVTGRVEAIEDTEWTVAGQTVVVDDATDVDDDVEIGDLVRVDGVILEDGVLLAQHINRIEEQPGLPFHFVGVVQDIADEAWTISGVTITVDADTEIDVGLSVGDVVQVHGWILDDGSWLARSIARVEEEEREFELVGYVESIAPWVVAGIPFQTDEWTEIEPDIRPGDRVRVTGRITEDGVWMASEIERLDEDDEAIDVVFVGTVESTDPWVVSGIPLAVDDETIVEDDVSVGDLVKVEARILPDGTWLATKIAPVSVDGLGLGCVSISAIVVRVNADQIELLNGPTIPLDDDVAVAGDLATGSVIVIVVCVDADGTIHIVSIIVIYWLEPPVVPTPTVASPPPTPPAPPSTPPPEEGGSDKVTICHKPNSKNPHTLTISRSALPAHLGHGDTLGPCPQ
jgi:hypothetical protein